MVTLFLVCLSIAIYGYRKNFPDLASTVVDLAKQILAGILTLLVAARQVWPSTNGNGKGETHVETSRTAEGGSVSITTGGPVSGK
jgi:hypothetical protein